MDYEPLPSPGAPIANIGNSQFQDEGHNKGVVPVFFINPVQNFKRTEEFGSPQFDDHEMCMIIIPNDEFNRSTHPVDDAIKERFPQQYAAWKASRKEIATSGTPIREWPMMTPSMIETMKAAGVKTIESLAEASEATIRKIDNGAEWQARAVSYLELARDSAAIQRYAVENQRLKDEIAELSGENARLRARLDADPEKRGPGRPPKVAA